MKRIELHILLAVVITALFLWLIYPPKDTMRLGRDLRGGVSLIYSVDIPQGADSATVLKDVITVLKDRVNPQGVFDITFLPQGYNRIEVVMPMPTPEVQAQQITFRQALDALLGASRVDRDEIAAAAQAGNAATRYGGVDETRKAKLAELEQAAAAAVDAQRRIDAAAAANDDAARRAAIADLAAAEVKLEQGSEALASLGVSERRIMRALSLSNSPKAKLDPQTGTPLRDASGSVVMGASEREDELALLRAEFPWLAPEIDRVVDAWEVYEERRTGLDSPEDLKRLFRGAGILEFYVAVDETSPEGVNPEDLRRQLAERGPEGTDSPVARWFKIQDLKQWTKTPADLAAARQDPIGYFARRGGHVAGVFEGETYLLLYTTDGRSIVHSPDRPWAMVAARPDVDDLGRQAVSFHLDAAGGQLMGRLTSANVGRQMAVVLDKQVYTAAQINSTIRDRGIIQGNFTKDDIEYMTRVLAAGALSGQLSAEPVSVNVLGPSLGADNLVRGLKAVLFSIVVTVVLMLGWYLVAGIIANIVLAFIIVALFGMMVFIDSTFTMPGLAGIALSIAMAVDTNVLIFERMREELTLNKEPLRTATRLGFSRAFSAIFDSQITGIMVCIVLIYLAGAEVRGFGVTMLIGGLITLVGGVWLSRVLLAIYTEWMGARSLPMLPTIFPNLNARLVPSVDWIRLRPLLFGATGGAALLGLALTASRGGAILDTEFRGGVSMRMTTRQVETRPYETQSGDTPATIASKTPGVPASAIEALNPDVDFAHVAPGTTIRVPTSGPASSDGRILLGRQEVERRVREMGDAAAPDSVAGQFRNAAVLTMGEQTPDFKSSSFQVKIGNPPGGVDETVITGQAVEALAETFTSELDAQLSRTFKGAGADHTGFTRPIDKRTIGESIGRPEIADPAGRMRGGVAVILEGIEPPITLDETRARIARMRTQPDFSDVAGRETRVFGLDAVDPAAPDKGYRGVAIVVSDPLVNLPKAPLETWDARLAAREWALATQALTQETSLDEVASFSPSVAQALLANAVIAVSLSLILMLGYIWIRFGSLRYSLGTIVALAFNISVCLGFIAASEWLADTTFGASIGIQEIRIDLNVIAGLLAVMGYSINDSIVILDRVRERRGRMAHATKQVVNDAVNQTFSRTMLTGGATILSALILIIVGGESIRPLSITLFVGLIVGTIGSVAIAAPLVYAGRRVEDTGEAPPAQAGASALARSA